MRTHNSYSCLRIPWTEDRGSWRASVYGGGKEWDTEWPASVPTPEESEAMYAHWRLELKSEDPVAATGRTWKEAPLAFSLADFMLQRARSGVRSAPPGSCLSGPPGL